MSRYHREIGLAIKKYVGEFVADVAGRSGKCNLHEFSPQQSRMCRVCLALQKKYGARPNSLIFHRAFERLIFAHLRRSSARSPVNNGETTCHPALQLGGTWGTTCDWPAEQCHSCAGIPPFAHSDRKNEPLRPSRIGRACFASRCPAALASLVQRRFLESR